MDDVALDTRALAADDEPIVDGAALRARLLDATIASVASVGVAKTTVADVARIAGCSRATAYRLFPGKRGLMLAAAHREVTGFGRSLATRLAEVDDLEDALVLGLVESHRFLADHAALRYVFDHEPGVVLPFFGFKHIDTLYAAVGSFAGRHLGRFLDEPQAAWAGEWVARAALSYRFHAAGALDLSRPADARRLVRRFLMPAFVPADGNPSATDS